MPIDTINPELCTGCGLCQNACPMDVIYMDEQTGKATIRYKKDCVACYDCEKTCPVNAVYVTPHMGYQRPKAW